MTDRRITEDGDLRITEDSDIRILEDGSPYTPWGPNQRFVMAGGDQTLPQPAGRQRFLQTEGFQTFDTDPSED